MFNQPIIAAWLLKGGANPNPKYEGKTPLAMAVEKKQTDLIQVLLSHGGQNRSGADPGDDIIQQLTVRRA
jgi:ankyrin repeat protein